MPPVGRPVEGVVPELRSPAPVLPAPGHLRLDSGGEAGGGGQEEGGVAGGGTAPAVQVVHRPVVR